MRLLGRDHGVFGTIDGESVARTAIVISPGGDGLSGARGAKIDCEVPNEDAVVAIDAGDRVLLAVSDGHWGHRASHVLVESLSVVAAVVPASPLELLGLLPRLAARDPSLADGSEATLLVAVVDRRRKTGFGFSLGDSACFVVGSDGGGARRCDRPNRRYVDPWQPQHLDPRRAREFEFDAAAGSRVLVCTDGIHECHYGDPSRSIRLRHLAAIAAGATTIAGFARDVAELALAGVDGHAGGQDNLAIAATCV